ncbi:ribonuclease HII [Ignicoccus hospitalis]|nr:ribonuclease HII [Ignicoccus hospitalis]HIH90609.1 ribonuclease HII [Desulfurococcaceae archaeon]
MIVAGIDEAGRGPVIGSMFVALVAIEQDQLEKLVSLGLKESKMLTPNKRRYFYNLIMKTAKLVLIKEVKAEEIDKRNLSELTIEVMKELLETALNKVKIDVVCVDIVGNGAKQRRALGEVFPDVIVMKKGDASCPAAAAASIVAKEARERHVSQLRARYGDFGSGYPSDPKTLRWLSVTRPLPPIVRKKWKTIRRKGMGVGGEGERKHDNSA